MLKTQPPTAHGERQSRPEYFDGYVSNGGLGAIPRRGWDERTSGYLQSVSQTGIGGLRVWAESAPLRLLRVLVAMDPLGQMAMSNDLTLAFAPGDTRIVAVKDYQDGKGTVDDDTTEMIDHLWRPYHNEDTDLSAEVSGLMTIQHTLGQEINTVGMYSVEAVPGPEGTGVGDIADFDSLSCRYRATKEGKRVFEQRQSAAKDGWQTLDMTTVLAVAWRASRDNPYGQPRYGAFLGEGLSRIGEKRNVKDWLKASAWPRLAFDFPFDAVVKYAKDNPDVLVGGGKDGADLTPYQYAETQLNAFKALMNTLNSSDTIMTPSGSKGTVLNASGISGLSDVLAMRRLEAIQSLDQLPNLMGVTDGGTQAYASVQWATQTKKLEALRNVVNSGLVAIANLHLRLMGVDMIARADVKPIRSLDLVAEQTARQMEIENELTLIDRGLMAPEDAAMALTGTGVFDATRVYSQQPKQEPPEPAPDPEKDDNHDED